MKILKIEIEADDDFEIGDCADCPLSYYETDVYIPRCVLDGTKQNCPIVEVKDERN